MRGSGQLLSVKIGYTYNATLLILYQYYTLLKLFLFIYNSLFLSLNSDPEHNPYFPKKKLEEEKTIELEGQKFLIRV